MSTLQTDYKLIRRSIPAAVVLRSDLRARADQFFTDRDLKYTFRTAGGLLSFEFLIEFYGDGDVADTFDAFLSSVLEDALSVTVTVPRWQYKMLRDEIDSHLAGKTSRGIFRRQVSLELSVANARTLYYLLMGKAKTRASTPLTGALCRALVDGGWTMVKPDTLF